MIATLSLRIPKQVLCHIQFLVAGLRDIAEIGTAIGMENWHFFYVDERCVPFTDDYSNHGAAAPLYDKVCVYIV